MPELRSFFSQKTFSTVLVVLLSLSTLLPLTRESLPASSASNIITLLSTITSGATDYSADTPSTGPLVTSGSAATYYIDMRNSPGSADSLENIFLSTKDLTSWSGTPICTFVTGTTLDHTTFDFDSFGTACSFDGSYNISGAGFPSSLAPGDGVYIRITGLSVGSSTISMTATANANFTSQTTFTSKDPAYARVGDIIITGHVFNDLDGDGINLTPDFDYVGIGMNLLQEEAGVSPGSLLGTTMTDENGYYSFNELDTAGITAGQDYRVSSLATINRLTTGNNVQQFFGITNGTNITTDIGFHVPQQSLVGDRVWYDANQDGIQDISETTGMGGTRLRLFNANTDTLLDTITSASNGDYKVGNDPINPQCFGRNINQAGGSTANTIVSYTCQVQAGGQYYLTLRTDFFCSTDQSAFRLYDAGENILAEGSCGRAGYPTNMEPKHAYTFGPFTESQAGIPHLDVIDGYGDFTFSDVNWQYSGPIGYDAYVVIDDIPVSYQISPADQTDDTLDSDITSVLLSGTEYRTDNFFFQLDNFNRDIDVGLYGPPPATTDLTITKTVTTTGTSLGDTVTYTITVTNTTSATNVVVSDILPASLTYSAQNASIGSYSALSGEWVIGDMADNGNETLTIDATINDASGDSITNTASVTSDTAELNATDNSDSVNISLTIPTTSADLEITKTAIALDPQLGNTITYTITVTNTSGATTATGVVVTDLLPASVSYVSQSASVGTYVPGTGDWTIGDILPGANSTLSLDVTITDDSAKIYNTATVTSSTFDPSNANNSSTVSTTPTTPPPPSSTDLSLTKTVDAPTPLLGETATYTITVTNTSGVNTATGVTITDILPSSLTYVTQTTTSSSYNDTLGIWDIGTMAPSATDILTITTTINDDSRAIDNTATVSSGSFDPISDNNSSTASFTPSTPSPAPSADLGIIKTATAPDPQLGGTIVYEITVTNNSSDTASTNVSVMDTLPSSVHFESDSLSVGTLTDNIWSIGTLDPSSSATMTITVTITDTSSTIINTASVVSDTSDLVSSNNSSSVSVIPTTPTPSPTPTVTSTPTPSPTPTVTSTSTPSGSSGGGTVSPPGITVTNGGSSNSSSSGWHYTSNDSPTRTSKKQAQIAQPLPAIPPVPNQDPMTCLQTNGIAALNFSDIQVTADKTKAQFLTSILNRGTTKRLIQGYNNQTYGMGNQLTRFELTKIALESNCLQTNQLQSNTVFSDVPHDNSEMSVIIGTAQALGIVNGKDGKFYPNQAVTYAEMSKILLGSGFYFQQHSPAITYAASFTGITDESFRQYAEYAVRLGLVSLDNGSFPQNRPIYRDTMLQVLSRYISYLKSISITN